MSSEGVRNCAVLRYFEGLEEFIRGQADRATTQAFRSLDRANKGQVGGVVDIVMALFEDGEAPLAAISALEAVDEITNQQEMLKRAIGNCCVCPVLYDEHDTDRELPLCTNPALAPLALLDGTLGYRVQDVWRDVSAE